MKNTIKAHQVMGTKQGWKYATFSATVKSETEQQALDKVKKICKEFEAYTFEIIPVEVCPIDSKLQTDSYPYGRERTTAFFSIEYNSNKGCRTVFQTINPKNGRINNPKKSTYSPVILPCILPDGKISYCGYLDFNGDESINKGLMFMSDFYELFSIEQIKDIALFAIGMSKVNAKAQVIYCGTDFETLKPLVEPSIKNLMHIAKTGENLFMNSFLDCAAIEALKKPDFNPFKVTEYVNN